MNKSKSVPLPIYESEMEHKNKIIRMLICLVFTMLAVLCLTIYMFVKFIGGYDFTEYNQTGNGKNEMNISMKGEIANGTNSKDYV